MIVSAVPEDRPSTPPTPFVDRFWDKKDGWDRTGVGMANADEWAVLPRPIFNEPLGDLIGTPAQWESGLSYADYLAGEHGDADPACSLAQRSEGGLNLRGTAYQWHYWSLPRHPRSWRLIFTRLAGPPYAGGTDTVIPWGSTSQSWFGTFGVGSDTWSALLDFTTTPRLRLTKLLPTPAGPFDGFPLAQGGIPETWTLTMNFASGVYRIDGVSFP